MLLVVVPQFEGLFSDAHGKLPFATRMVMAASETVRQFGLLMVLGLVGLVFAVRQWLRRPGVDQGVRSRRSSACRSSVP